MQVLGLARILQGEMISTGGEHRIVRYGSCQA